MHVGRLVCCLHTKALHTHTYTTSYMCARGYMLNGILCVWVCVMACLLAMLEADNTAVHLNFFFFFLNITKVVTTDIDAL